MVVIQGVEGFFRFSGVVGGYETGRRVSIRGEMTYYGVVARADCARYVFGRSPKGSIVCYLHYKVYLRFFSGYFVFCVMRFRRLSWVFIESLAGVDYRLLMRSVGAFLYYQRVVYQVMFSLFHLSSLASIRLGVSIVVSRVSGGFGGILLVVVYSSLKIQVPCFSVWYSYLVLGGRVVVQLSVSYLYKALSFAGVCVPSYFSLTWSVCGSRFLPLSLVVLCFRSWRRVWCLRVLRVLNISLPL